MQPSPPPIAVWYSICPRTGNVNIYGSVNNDLLEEAYTAWDKHNHVKVTLPSGELLKSCTISLTPHGFSQGTPSYYMCGLGDRHAGTRSVGRYYGPPDVNERIWIDRDVHGYQLGSTDIHNSDIKYHMVLMQVPEYSPPDESGKVPHWYWAKRTCNTLPRGVEKYSNRVFSFTNNVLDWEPYSLENGEVIEKEYQDGSDSVEVEIGVCTATVVFQKFDRSYATQKRVVGHKEYTRAVRRRLIDPSDQPMAIDENADDCVLCTTALVQPGFKTCTLPCSHQFHGTCLVDMIGLDTSYDGPKCPMCRAPFTREQARLPAHMGGRHVTVAHPAPDDFGMGF